jgi:PPOX class probable F420-dependent enzyme
MGGVLPPTLRARIAGMRVAHLATAHRGKPAVVPISFALVGDRLYSAIDAKPKGVPPEQLRRVRYLRANPQAAVLVDHYEEDWSRLWFVLLEGPVRLLERGAEHGRAIAALRRKYPQYVGMPLREDALVIALDVAAWREWRSATSRSSTDRRPRRAVPTGRAGQTSGSTRSPSTGRRTGSRN